MRDIGTSAKVNEQMEISALFKYLELLTKINHTPETSSMYRYRLNRACNEIEKKLGMEDVD